METNIRKWLINIGIFLKYDNYVYYQKNIKAAPYDENFQFCQFWKFNLYEAI